MDAAVLSVKSAAQVLGVHPNTIRAWTDRGRLPCLRINERGDRRYRLADLHGFLRSAAGNGNDESHPLVTGAGIDATRRVPAVVRVEPLEPAMFQGAAEPPAATEPAADAARLGLLTGLTRIATSTTGREAALDQIARALRIGGGFDIVAITERTPAGQTIRVVDGSTRRHERAFKLDTRLAEVCLRDARPIAAPRSRPNGSGSYAGRWPPAMTGAMDVFVPIRSPERAWGCLVVESPATRPLGRQDLDLLFAVGNQLALTMGWSRLREMLQGRRAQAQALARVTTELSARFDLPEIMSGMVDHAIRLFGADRAGVFLYQPDGSFRCRSSRNLSDRFIQAVSILPRPSLGVEALETGRAVWTTGYADDARGAGLREVVLAEGFDSLAIVPLLAEGEVVGIFCVYHDTHHPWEQDDLQILEALGAHGGVAVRNAANYEQMATWAAQLHSIQQLGARLGRLSTVRDIGEAIASELNQLIDFHNVRVYRIDGQACVPVAWRGHIGEYTDEDAGQLEVQVGEGITGWVAEHGEAQYLPDAATDPRSQTIPGTDDDLPESMLLAPMLHEDRVLGVIVLSKLGIDQFAGPGALRLLEIYASLAAQAMTNADATERLKAQSERLGRQLRSQRELMRMTESILSTLDPRLVMENIADRVSALVKVDNLAIGIYDAGAHVLRPIFARGVDSEIFMARTIPDDQSISGWVARNGEARLVQDGMADARDVRFAADDHHGASIVTPLRARDRVIGILTLERLGSDASFDEEEFELLKLFSGHVSIALQNALAHQAVELKAQTDALTGLKNHGAFAEHLALAVARGTTFSLLLVDLDDFKSFNDRRGHDAGSRLLTGIAHAMRSSGREADEVFRYGGDEFTLILPGADLAGARAVGTKLVRAVRDVTIAGLRRSGITCSVGVASFPMDAEDGRHLVMAADRACYQAKRLGGDGVATAAEAAASGTGHQFAVGAVPAGTVAGASS